MSESSWSDDSLRLIFERYRRPLPARQRPPGMSAAAREALAERLLPAAAELACLVRDEGAAATGAFIAALPPGDRDALLVILAALVPGDRPFADLLGWVTWDGEGRPLDPAEPARRRYRRTAPLMPCGSLAAYWRHLRARERACNLCSAAKAADDAGRERSGHRTRREEAAA